MMGLINDINKITNIIKGCPTSGDFLLHPLLLFLQIYKGEFPLFLT